MRSPLLTTGNSDLAASEAGTQRNKELPATQKELIVLEMIPKDEWVSWSADDAAEIRVANFLFHLADNQSSFPLSLSVGDSLR